MTTATDLANMALDLLDEAPISSLEDQRPIGKWLKRNFAVTRDSVLERANWNFALKRAALPEDSTAPAFGWSYAYSLPGECLRVIPLTHDGTSEGYPVAHEIEDRKIFTNLGGPLRVRYVFRNENYGVYPACFQEALAGRLAMKMAHFLTGKSSYVQIAQAMYDDAIQSAWLTDAIEGTSPRAADSEWILAR